MLAAEQCDKETKNAIKMFTNEVLLKLNLLLLIHHEDMDVGLIYDERRSTLPLSSTPFPSVICLVTFRLLIKPQLMYQTIVEMKENGWKQLATRFNDAKGENNIISLTTYSDWAEVEELVIVSIAIEYLKKEGGMKE